MTNDYDSFFTTAMGGAHGPYDYQVRFATAERLPELLRAPTGAGKTAASVLGWWWRRKCGPAELRQATPRRLVFCLPMRSLVRQTEAAIEGWKAALEQGGYDVDVSVHSLLGGDVDQTWEMDPDKDLILVGTQDQLLSRALNRGYAMSRYRWPVHFALVNNDALWVMDEVQLMGVGLSTSAQLQGFALPTYGPRRTVWMSATLPSGKLNTVDLDTTKLSTVQLGEADTRHPALSRRLTATKRIHQLADVFDGKSAAYAKKLTPHVLKAHHTNGGRTLVVVNRVDRAVALVQALRKEAPDTPSYVVHSRFRPDDRAAVEHAATRGSEDAIVVATQAIEAGVDMTSRTLFTELAPWSSLVQRFGRCNRGGECEQGADIYWIDIPDDDKAALPYTTDDFTTARTCLGRVPGADAKPQTLPGDPGPHEPDGPVLRRKDFLELFDTSADLSGFDVDISRYIRDTGTPDVQVAWRTWDGDAGGKPPTGPARAALQRAELCRVPIHSFDKLFPKQTRWKWDPLKRVPAQRRGDWARADRIKPGDTILVPISAGGYDQDEDQPERSLGFLADRKHKPAPVAFDPDKRPESDEGDEDSLVRDGRIVTLRDHALDVRREAEALSRDLDPGMPWSKVVAAAHWHDLGKVHPAWQAMITSRLPVSADHEPWAKRPRQASRPATLGRSFFRHELASALAYLAHPEPDELVAYLIACHHGKVRTTLRSRPQERPRANVLEELGWPKGSKHRVVLGVYDGETLPSADLGEGLVTGEVPLDLSISSLGTKGSWVNLVAVLLQTFGPLRLAMLEAVVRVADWRASAQPTYSEAIEVNHADA